jgi:type I restriction enzyme S subunit
MSTDHWIATRLSEIAEVRLGRQRSPSRATGPNMRPYMRAANVTWNGISLHDVKEMDFTPAEFETYRLRRGDILLSEASGSASEVGKPAVWEDQVPGCCFQNTLIRVRASEELVPFLHMHFYKDAITGAFADASRGVGIHHLGVDAIAEWRVRVPPLNEQRRIVAAIESYFTRLDDTVATLERVQRNLKRYRALVLKAAVEGRLVPTEAELARAEGRSYEPASVLLERILAERRRRWEEAELAKMKARGEVPKDHRWKERYKDPATADVPELPELPDGWCWATVDQLAVVGTGATPKRGEARFWNGGDVPWVTSAVVNGPMVKAPSALVTRAALAETNLILYPPGTLLIAMYGEGMTRGRSTILGIESTTNQALAALELPDKSSECREWLLLFLEHNYLELRRFASGGVQPNLNLGIIRAICVPIPPLAEQRRINDEIARSSSVVESMEGALAANEAKASRLRQSILKWAFEGRLVDQDPTDEPAAVLLERIRTEREATAAKTVRSRRGVSSERRIPGAPRRGMSPRMPETHA